MEIARFTKRVFSYIIDFIISYGIGVSLGALLFIFTDLSWFFALLITLVICYLIYLLINVPLMYASKGRSFGAFIFGIKTIGKDNQNISLRNSLIKNLYLGLLPFILANAFYMLAVHTEQTLFDRITDTVVIDIKNTNI